nr:MAG TPA: hypothetical protein [Crassvirales sp.]
MTEEKIKQGEELLNKLNRLKDQRSRWEKGVCFSRVELADAVKGYTVDRSIFSIDSSFINFDEVKLLATAKIDKRISEVQEEFDKL